MVDEGEEYLYCVTVAVIIALQRTPLVWLSTIEHISNFYYQCAIIDYQFQLVYLLSEGQLIHVVIFTLILFHLF